MHYSVEELNQRFPAALLIAARRLLEQGRVAQLDIRQDGSLITGLFDTPGESASRVYIRIESDATGRVALSGECSCMERVECAHIAAVLLQALTVNTGLVGEDAFPALHETPTTQFPDDGYPPSVSQRLLYGLFREPSASAGLPIRTFSASVLPNGRFDNLRGYDPAWAQRGRPPRFLRALDVQSLAELNRLPPDRQERRWLHHNPGEQLLYALLQSGRLYLRQTELALRCGDTRDSLVRWRIDSQGRQYPLFESTPATALQFR